MATFNFMKAEDAKALKQAIKADNTARKAGANFSAVLRDLLDNALAGGCLNLLQDDLAQLGQGFINTDKSVGDGTEDNKNPRYASFKTRVHRVAKSKGVKAKFTPKNGIVQVSLEQAPQSTEKGDGKGSQRTNEASANTGAYDADTGGHLEEDAPKHPEHTSAVDSGPDKKRLTLDQIRSAIPHLSDEELAKLTSRINSEMAKREKQAKKQAV